MKNNYDSNQEKIWDKIAPEWYLLKTHPDARVLEFLSEQKGNIIDFGSGAGRHFIKLKTRGRMYLVDFSKKMIALAKKRAKKLKFKAEFFVSNLERTPFDNDFFDAAIFIAVLHCIPGKVNRRKVVKELFRVLKPGAKAMICVWNKNTKWFKNKPKEIRMSWKNLGRRYLYLYDAKEIYGLFEKSGFKIIKKFPPEKNILFIAQKP